MTKKEPQNNKPDHAFILAAGKGTRLRPYTDDCPKPMVHVHGRPILEHTIDKLEKEGVWSVTINLNYLGDRIKNYFEKREQPALFFSEENELLDTGGGVKHALETMGQKPFYLINGDAFWTDKDETALERLADYWNPETMDILLLLQPVENMTLTQPIGDYDLKEDGQAVRSLDKSGAYMFGGVRITKPELFDGTPDGAFSFLALMDQAQKKRRLYGLIHIGDWHHISTPEDLERVNAALEASPIAKTA